MRNIGIAAVLAAILGLTTACGGGGGDGNGLSLNQELQACLEDGSGYVFGLLQAKQIVERLIQSDGQLVDPLASVSPGIAENSWEYTVLLDLDGDGANDTEVFGTVTFSSDPRQGIEPGDVADFEWDIEGNEGLGGSGTLFIEYGEAESFSVSGYGDFAYGDGCDLGFLIDENTPLFFGFAPVPVAQVGGTEVFGVILAGLQRGDHSIDAVLELLQDDNTVFVTDVEIDGDAGPDFNFELPLGGDAFGVLRYCASTHWEGSFLLISSLLDAVGAVVEDFNLAGGEVAIEGATVTYQVVNLTTVSFQVAYDGLGDFSDGDSVSGTASFSALPAPNADVTLSISFEFVSNDGLIRVFTAEGAPISVLVELADTAPEDPLEPDAIYFSGRLECEFDEQFFGPAQQSSPTSCRASITVDEAAPIELGAYLNGLETSVAFTLESFYGSDNLRYTIVQESNTEFAVRAYLNGYPIPSNDFLFVPFID